MGHVRGLRKVGNCAVWTYIECALYPAHVRYSVQASRAGVKIKRTVGTYAIDVTCVIAHIGGARLYPMTPDPTPGDKLRLLREAASLSLREASALSGISHSHIREIERIPGKAENMTASTMRGLGNAYGVTVEQIVRIATGRAVMPREEDGRDRPAGAQGIGGTVMVRFMGDVSAGLASFGTESEPKMLEVPTIFLEGFEPKDVFALRVNGASMLSDDARKNIADGSIVLVNEQIKPLPGQLVVCWLHNEDLGVIKSWKPDGDRSWLVSYNGEHPPIRVDETAPATLYGVVIGHWTRAPGI